MQNENSEMMQQQAYRLSESWKEEKDECEGGKTSKRLLNEFREKTRSRRRSRYCLCVDMGVTDLLMNSS